MKKDCLVTLGYKDGESEFCLNCVSEEIEQAGDALTEPFTCCECKQYIEDA